MRSRGVFSIRVYFTHLNRSPAMNPSPNAHRFAPERALELGRQTLSIEAAAVSALQGRLNGEFSRAVALILGIWPRLVALALVPVLLGAIVTVHGPAGFFFTNPKGGWEFLVERAHPGL